MRGKVAARGRHDSRVTLHAISQAFQPREQLSAQEVRENRIEVSMKLATIYSATVLLKGPGPICASADGVIIFPLASADLAVAGSGDILAGMIGGFCASGMDVGRACLKALSIQKKVVQLGKGAVNWRSYEAAMGY